MTLYKVQITNKALTDMEEIYTYIAEVLQTPDNAMSQYNRIAKAIEGLGVFPERIKIMETEPKRGKNIRGGKDLMVLVSTAGINPKILQKSPLQILKSAV